MLTNKFPHLQKVVLITNYIIIKLNNPSLETNESEIHKS